METVALFQEKKCNNRQVQARATWTDKKKLTGIAKCILKDF